MKAPGLPWVLGLLLVACGEPRSPHGGGPESVPSPAALVVPPSTPPGVNPTAPCPVPSMEALYGGILPINPYVRPPRADACVAREHDAIVVLGCPGRADGRASPCQERRADLAVRLGHAGYGRWFIPTGGAVGNAHVEADTLAGLLVARGVPRDRIVPERRARHTDENFLYATRILEERGWEAAVVVSDDPGHLVMTALCDANCCVRLGRLTVFTFPDGRGGDVTAGHYVRHPWGGATAEGECEAISARWKFMCTNRSRRTSCMDRPGRAAGVEDGRSGGDLQPSADVR